MNKEQIIDSISTNYSFLTTECKTELFNNSQILTIEKETVIVKEGQLANKMYFILYGVSDEQPLGISKNTPTQTVWNRITYQCNRVLSRLLGVKPQVIYFEVRSQDREHCL